MKLEIMESYVRVSCAKCCRCGLCCPCPVCGSHRRQAHRLYNWVRIILWRNIQRGNATCLMLAIPPGKELEDNILFIIFIFILDRYFIKYKIILVNLGIHLSSVLHNLCITKQRNFP